MRQIILTTNTGRRHISWATDAIVINYRCGFIECDGKCWSFHPHGVTFKLFASMICSVGGVVDFDSLNEAMYGDDIDGGPDGGIVCLFAHTRAGQRSNIFDELGVVIKRERQRHYAVQFKVAA